MNVGGHAACGQTTSVFTSAQLVSRCKTLISIRGRQFTRAWASRLEIAEASWSHLLEVEQRASAARLTEANQRAAAEHAAAVENWALAADAAEKRWHCKLEALRAKCVHEVIMGGGHQLIQ